jgi:DNA-binding MarR family transcriptional regulator
MNAGDAHSSLGVEMDTFASHDFSADFASLTPEGQEQVLNLMRRLSGQQPASNAEQREKRRRLIEKLTEGITPEDIAAMKAAEAECERIDPNGW